MRKLNHKYVVVGILFFVVLFLVTLLRQNVPFWDEAYYLENIKILNDQGFTKEFLIQYKGPAGPTYALMHYVLNPITGLQAPYVRLVNIIFLTFTIIIIWLTLKKVNKANKYNLAFAISTLSIPTVYTIAGMALTEMFAVFFLSIFTHIVIKVYVERKYLWYLAVIAGLSLSLAILGRQPVLMLLLALPIFMIEYKSRFRINLPSKGFSIFLVITFVTSLIIPLSIFRIWGNIQPPSQASIGIGLEPKHLILALGYSALYVLFLNPSYFKIKKDISNKFELLAIVLLSVFLNIFLLKVRFTPFTSIISNIVSNDYLSIYSFICGSFLTLIGLLFLYYFMKKQVLQFDKVSMFLSIGFLLIITTTIKVTHQFSARYIAQAFPLILLAVSYKREKIKVIDIMTLILGGLLGLISLESNFI